MAAAFENWRAEFGGCRPAPSTFAICCLALCNFQYLPDAQFIPNEPIRSVGQLLLAQAGIQSLTPDQQVLYGIDSAAPMECDCEEERELCLISLISPRFAHVQTPAPVRLGRLKISLAVCNAAHIVKCKHEAASIARGDG